VAIGDDTHLPQLWFALSQQELTAHLHEQRNRLLALVFVGCLGGLIIGFMMLKNFSAPLGRLVKLTEEVGAGRYPEIPRGSSHDEIGYLTNRFSEMVTSLREQQDEVTRVQSQLEHEATTDSLTGFYNRRYLYNIFPKLWSEAMRSKKNQTLIIVDIDHFKKVNDVYGHQMGDRVLLHFSRVLRDNSRVSDFIFRLGGEEFLVLTNGDNEGGMHVAEKIRMALESDAYNDGELSIPLTASFGVAQAENVDGVDGLSRMLQRADKALYMAKTSGRNRVVVWYPQRESA
jgi:diguanylate cyclase (GGDEF)-like protein